MKKQTLYILLFIFILLAIYLVFLNKATTESFTQEGPRNLAIIISGRIKGYEYVEEQLKELQKKYNATFFISLNKKEKNNYIDVFCNKFNIRKEQIVIKESFAPEWMRHFNVKYDIQNRLWDGIDTTYSMFYNIKSAFNLIKPYQEKYNTIFDCVLFYRADINSNKLISIGVSQPNTIYIPNGYDYGGINGLCAYGDYYSMKKYSNLVDNIKIMCEKQGVIFHPETLLKNHLKNEKLNIVRFEFPFTLHPKRHEYNPEYDDTP